MAIRVASPLCSDTARHKLYTRSLRRVGNHFANLNKLATFLVLPMSRRSPGSNRLRNGEMTDRCESKLGRHSRVASFAICSFASLNSRQGATKKEEWSEIVEVVSRWFSVTLLEPKYVSGQDTQITVEFRQRERNYDIIAGGSGFHQALTLLAFFYGYEPTTILLDEPDAHLHVNLQREILDYFKEKSLKKGTQFLIATHAEEFARGVDASQIVSLLNRVPRARSNPPGNSARYGRCFRTRK